MALLLVEDNARLSASLTRGLREDGFEKVSKGQTTVDEILRVTEAA